MALLIVQAIHATEARAQVADLATPPVISDSQRLSWNLRRGSARRNLPSQRFVARPVDPLRTSQDFSYLSVLRDDEKDGFHILHTELGISYVYWFNTNYLGNTDISPTFVLSPSVSLSYKQVTISLTYDRGVSVENTIVTDEVIDQPAILNSDKLVTEISKQSDSPVFRTRFELGKFRGTGFYSFIEDTLQFEKKTETLNIKNNAVQVDFLAGRPNFLVGLKFMSYKVPTLVRSEEVPDPRDETETIVKIEMPNTRINHIFVLVDMFYMLGNALEKPPDIEDQRRLRFNLIGHLRWLLLGLGVAENDFLGRVGTFSFFYDNEAVKPLDALSGYDAHLGLRTRLKLFQQAMLKVDLGARWVSWRIRSWLKEIDDLDMQMISTEASAGPYAQISLSF